jgi:hypothetical protein
MQSPSFHPLKSPDQQRRKRLEELEVIIHGSNLKMGEALLEIRNERLYRDCYSSFDEYCRKRWNRNRDWAYKSIRHVEKIRDFKTKTDSQLYPIEYILPANEAQSRELNGLTFDQQIEVMKEVGTTGEKITAKLIRELASKYKQAQDLAEEFENDEVELEDSWNKEELTELEDEPMKCHIIFGECNSYMSPW